MCVKKLSNAVAAMLLYLSVLIAANEWSDSLTIKEADFEYLNAITTEEWDRFIQLGVESVDNQKRLELNILSSQVTIENGSISHMQLLDSLPNAKAFEDSETAMKILQSSLYLYNSICVNRNIDGSHCEAFLSQKLLPATNPLRNECNKILDSSRDGHHPFRRLLPRNYKDGFNEMWLENKLPSPRLISSKALESQSFNKKDNVLDDNYKSLSLVQWTEFIEHDLSKPVVNSMLNGNAIECCNKQNYKLLPRYHHPACAPLIAKDSDTIFGRETCLNYVRSTLVIGSECTFAAPEQLNQATGNLDLSQLYGFTEMAENKMRTFKDGKIKSTPAAHIQNELLPMVSGDTHTFCAWKLTAQNISTCFMAGDSRVNRNPFAIVIYTLFMRNHNQIAKRLKYEHNDWNDQHLFTVAKTVNVNIYRNIIFNEWLPAVLGKKISRTISNSLTNTMNLISNEFGVAAIRFYFSMMPNELHDFSMMRNTNNSESRNFIKNNDILPDETIFVLKEQLYQPRLLYTALEMDKILESVLHQRANKMDNSYVESLIPNDFGKTRPTHADILAFDIQRGRDHGLQGYVKYLEYCTKSKINNWNDLNKFIEKEDLQLLEDTYKNLSDIDLIIGGISEIPVDGSTVGPTFNCIIAEQFAKILDMVRLDSFTPDESKANRHYESMTGADLICANSNLKFVPTNIFQVASERNSMVSCEDRTNLMGL